MGRETPISVWLQLPVKFEAHGRAVPLEAERASHWRSIPHLPGAAAGTIITTRRLIHGGEKLTCDYRCFDLESRDVGLGHFMSEGRNGGPTSQRV